jgi:hypothetical protein
MNDQFNSAQDTTVLLRLRGSWLTPGIVGDHEGWARVLPALARCGLTRPRTPLDEPELAPACPVPPAAAAVSLSRAPPIEIVFQVALTVTVVGVWLAPRCLQSVQTTDVPAVPG